MEELSIEDVQQLVNFYRQRASDLEYQLLQLQIKLNKLAVTQDLPVPATKITKTKSE